MLITSIRITNFRGIKSADIRDLPNNLLCLGFNGQGKTSLINALQFALYGRCFDQTGARIQNQDLIGADGNKAEIMLGIDIDGTPIEYAVTLNAKGASLAITTGGKPFVSGRIDEARAAFWKRAGVDQKHAECAGNPRAYLLGKELSTLLAQLGGSEIPQDALTEFCGANADWFADFTKRVAVAPDSVANIKAIGKAAYDERAIVNAGIKNLSRELEDLPAPMSYKKGATLKGAQQLIAQIRTERDELLQELGRVGVGRCAEEISAELEAKRAEHDKASADYATMVQESVALSANLDKAQAALSDAQTAHATAMQRVNELQYQLKAVDMQYAKFMENPEACPACRRPYTENQKNSYLLPITKEQERVKPELDVASTEVDAALINLQPARNDVKAMTETLSKSKEAIQDLVHWIKTITADIQRLENESPVVAESKDAIQDRIAELGDRIKKGEETIHAIQVESERARITGKLESLQAEQAYLQWAVDVFRDGEALNTLGSNGQQVFIGQCNEVLIRYGYELAVDTSGGELRLLFGRVGVAENPVSQVSDGELLIAQFAVAEAFCAGGLAPVIIDGLDGLDSTNKSLMIQGLAEACPGTIVFTSAWGVGAQPDCAALAGALAPTGVVWVEDGTAELHVASLEEEAA